MKWMLLGYGLLIGFRMLNGGVCLCGDLLGLEVGMCVKG
jgi:hypothetical protein